jgi:methyl-accepting chemotaxis protein
MGLGRTLTWPLRTFFDRRFEGVIQRVDAGREEAAARELYAQGRHQELEHELTTLYRLLRADMDATNEAVDLRARALAEIAGNSEAMAEQLSELREAVDELTAGVNALVPRAARLAARRAAD